MPDYQYQPLRSPDDIRLIKVDRATTSDRDQSLPELKVELVTVSLEQAPPYECVSYAWITKYRTQYVATGDGSKVQVTTSLLEALPYLMRACETGFLWIDQLSIDQDNTEERGQQVGIMSEIYSRAERLLIWLGPKSLDTIMLLEMIDALPDEPSSRHWYPGPDGFRLPADECCWSAVDDLKMGEWFEQQADVIVSLYPGTPYEKPEYRQRTRLAHMHVSLVAGQYGIVMSSVMGLPWFGRAWVLQEAIFARKLVFSIGDKLFDSSKLERLLGVMERCDVDLGRKAGGVQFPIPEEVEKKRYGSMYRKKLHYGSKYGEGFGFFRYIADIRKRASDTGSRAFDAFLWELRIGELAGRCEASDPRDVVFSLWRYYSVPQPCKPDYTLPVATVFRRAAEAFIESTGDLSLLTLADGVGRDQSSIIVLPSWVPDWTRSCVRLPLIFDGDGPTYGYSSACSSYKHRSRRSPGAGELVVQGKIVDRLSYVSRVSHTHARHWTGDINTSGVPLEHIREDEERFGRMVPTDLKSERVLLVQQAPVALVAEDPAIQLPDGFSIDYYSAQRQKLRLWEATTAAGRPHVNDGQTEPGEDVSRSWAWCGCEDDIVVNMPWPTQAFVLRVLAMTEGGHKCLVSDASQAGDAVVVLHGYPLPVILRHQSANRYQFVGEALVEEMMHGERVDWAENEADDIILI